MGFNVIDTPGLPSGYIVGVRETAPVKPLIGVTKIVLTFCPP